MSYYRSDSAPLKTTSAVSGAEVGVIVLAAGSGARFGGQKQFIELSPGVRLVDRSVATALQITPTVVVVVPPGHAWVGDDRVVSVDGGADRLASVRAGLAVMFAPIVVIHDAAHPLASVDIIRELVRSVRNGADASLPLWDVPDVVKQRSPDGLVTVGRNGFGLAQVPMAFRREALLAAHEGIARVGPEDAGAVEDSALIESAGGRVEAVPGEVTNVHVVDAASLALARHLVSLVGES